MGPCSRVSSGTTTLLGRVFCEIAAVSCCWVVAAFVSTLMVSGTCARSLGTPLGGIIHSGLSARSCVASCSDGLVMVWDVGGFDGNGVRSWTLWTVASAHSLRVLMAAFWSFRRHSNIVSHVWDGLNSVLIGTSCADIRIAFRHLQNHPVSTGSVLLAATFWYICQTDLAILTAALAAPFAWPLSGLLVSCSNCQFCANFLNTADAYCGPLSLTSVCGMPCRLKLFFSFPTTVSEVVPGR